MEKVFLFIIMLCSYAFAFAQHDMKNMPGMDTTKKAKQTTCTANILHLCNAPRNPFTQTWQLS